MLKQAFGYCYIIFMGVSLTIQPERPMWLNGLVLFYKLSGFESRSCNFRSTFIIAIWAKQKRKNLLLFLIC